MDTNSMTFPIYNADGTPFHDLVLHKATFDSVVMSLGDKITGDVYYKDNTLAVTMSEYIEFRPNEGDDAIRFILVSPPTVVREGMVSDNSDLHGMTKYSFVFYHPMCLIGNIPFTDIAVSYDEEKYLSQNKTFSWIGNLFDMVAKLNKNLQGTQWVVDTNIQHYEQDGVTETSMWQKAKKIPEEPLSFDKVYISDVLKTSYETWEIPFVVDQLSSSDERYAQGKRFVIIFGMPSNEILDGNGQPYVFRFGQGVGLKNNSRTPRNNKIVTRIVGYGSENNIPFGYPQIVWDGDIDDPRLKYPIYKGIVGGRYVNLIKHPFTRSTLMPSIYRETVNKKVNPNADGYDPDIEIVDYYDADGSFINPFNASNPSVEIHQFEDIKPELGEKRIAADAQPYNTPSGSLVREIVSVSDFLSGLLSTIMTVSNQNEKDALVNLWNSIHRGDASWTDGNEGGSYTFSCVVTSDEDYYYIKYVSDNINYNVVALKDGHVIEEKWVDDMDEEGNYLQSYFKITLPILDFDLYACASITQEMKINMRSGACIGCTFPIMVDWDDYKKNFYDSDGNFSPDGSQRDLEKYPKTNVTSVTLILQKEYETFGTIMPNIYQQPKSGDQFVILGISLPSTYETNAEARLDDAMMEYMRENNLHYYDYPLKFDEHFLVTHKNILSQIKNNTIVRFLYAGVTNVLYIKQMSIKYGESPLPKYDITLTDDVEIVLNQVGQVTDDVSRMRVQVNELQKYYSENLIEEINNRLSKIVDDVCQGRITFQQGLDSVGVAIFRDELRSPQFETGLYSGHGWRIDNLGNAEFESMRVRSYLEIVELLVNRQQAQEGDTIFSENDQIDRVDKHVDETDGSVSYVLSLKEKYDGYVTAIRYGTILRGKINTLAAKQAGVSNYNDSDAIETDGENTYYTSYMQAVGTHNTDDALDINQIRVVLYGDSEVPVGKNFEPCELMVVVRHGGFLDPNEQGISVAEKESRRRLQTSFYISASEGRIVKLVAVNKPKLENWNYGTTLGELPEFVKNYANVRERYIAGRDYLYAQGVVVGDFIKIDVNGAPISTVVYHGDWVDGSSIQNPTVGNGVYLKDEYNQQTQQYETSEVRYNGGRWQPTQHIPVREGGVDNYYPPKWNSPYWRLVDGNDNLTIEFVSSKGYSFRRGAVDTVITPHLYYGNVDITDDVAAEYWNWTRESESGKTVQDETWDAQHQRQKTLSLTNTDMPSTWSTRDKAIFTCTVTLNDGKTTRIVQNQIIS